MDICWGAFLKALRQHVATAGPAQQSIALILIEIQPFHIYNFQFGFEAGETIAAEVLTRLKNYIKKAVVLERIGVNEFAVIIEDVPIQELLFLSAQRIVDALRIPITVGDEALALDPYLGISLFPDHGQSAEALVSEARIALQRARDSGTAYHITLKKDSEKRLAQWQMEADLNRALATDGLRLCYQPKLNLQSLTPSTSEALMRWQLPNGQTIYPSRFIPVAEASGVIHQFTEWAINTALREVAELTPENGDELSVAVNVSTTSIYDRSLAFTVESALAIWNIAPHRLTLEITESSLIKNPQLCFKHLSELREIGAKIAIDDFGTGFSSLSYFKSIPADEIKIDKSFVKHMVTNEDDAKIVELIIELGHKFNLQVVAEGIEDRETLKALQALQCDYGQGYHIAKPMDYQSYQNWLSDFQIDRH